MIYFTAEEIYLSIIYSFIYGAGLALILTVFKVILGVRCAIGKYAESILHYERITKVENYCKYSKTTRYGRVYTVFSITMFFLGYLLLSYYALDGNLRIYTFLISLLSTRIFHRIIEPLISTLCCGLIHSLICPLVILLRIIMHPILKKMLSVRKKR
jgi:hypothetical protein